jgi:hypothetical protein
MKIVKGLAILAVFAVLFGSCFDPPEFPITPQISFDDINDIGYYLAAHANDKDSLVVSIHFKDGDGDLGLPSDDNLYISNPFHYQHYFLSNSQGTLDTIGTFVVQDSIQILDIPESTQSNQKLITVRTRSTNPLYSYLPPSAPLNCGGLMYDQSGPKANRIYVVAEDTIHLEKYPGDSLQRIIVQNVALYLVDDNLLVRYNQNYFNYEVDFMVEDGADFKEYDWRKEKCSFLDGRFPILSDRKKNIEGTLKYTMKSSGFRDFLGQRLKLRIQITDRTLHKSNWVETPEFTLDKIRKN